MKLKKMGLKSMHSLRCIHSNDDTADEMTRSFGTAVINLN